MIDDRTLVSKNWMMPRRHGRSLSLTFSFSSCACFSGSVALRSMSLSRVSRSFSQAAQRSCQVSKSFHWSMHCSRSLLVWNSPQIDNLYSLYQFLVASACLHPENNLSQRVKTSWKNNLMLNKAQKRRIKKSVGKRRFISFKKSRIFFYFNIFRILMESFKKSISSSWQKISSREYHLIKHSPFLLL